MTCLMNFFINERVITFAPTNSIEGIKGKDREPVIRLVIGCLFFPPYYKLLLK
jgi:hypothetical protein